MAAILRKIRADLLSRPLVSALITLTVAAATVLLTLALTTLMNASGPYNRSFAELNGAHVWLYLDRDRVRRRDLETLAQLPGVTASTGLQVSMPARVKLGQTYLAASLRAIPVEPPAVNRLRVTEGSPLTLARGQILAGREMNDLHQLKVGTTIEVTTQDGGRQALPVVGLAFNPMWDTYRTTQPPYLYVTEETLYDLFPEPAVWDWSVGLRLADPQAVDEVVDLAKATLPDGAITAHTDWREVRESAEFGVQINVIFLLAFSLFAIVAAALVLMTNIGAAVFSQFRQIGMLKAIGFTRGQIILLYVGQYLLLGLLGGLLGLGVGLLLAPFPLQSAAAALNTVARPPFNLILLATVLGSVVVLVVLTTVGPAWRGAQTNIIQAIAVGFERPRRRPSWLARLAMALGLPTTVVLGLKDAFARPTRAAMTCLNLTLGVVSIVFSLGLDATITTFAADPSLLGIVYDGVVSRGQSSDHRTQRLLARAPGVETFYSQHLFWAETSDGESLQVRALDGDVAAFPFHLPEGRFYEPGAAEVVVGQGLLDWLGLAVGDELALVIDEQPVRWRIVGRYFEPANAGQMAMVSLDTLRQVQRAAKPDTYFLKLAPGADASQLHSYLRRGPAGDLSVTILDKEVPAFIRYLQLTIVALALVLIAIALINVFNTAMLSSREKLKEIGVLKTIGMTPGQVGAMINVAAGAIGGAAVLIGIPLGLALTQIALAALGDYYGFGRIQTAINWPWLLLLAPLTVVVSMAGSYLPGRWAARVNIVEVLRYE